MSDSAGPVPVKLGPYILGDLLGRGGMGAVYRAHDPRLGRDVAIKVMLSGEAPAGDDKLLKRFLREMKVQASLSHPNIVKILDFGVDGGHHYFAMELLPGRTLKEHLEASGALPAGRVISIGIAMAGALAQLHAQGCVHRDIKPQNVFLRNDGAAVLMDLGLVKTTDSTIITSAGASVGTPRYLAPEALKGAEADALSDVYQLGLVLYEAATGHPAFDGDDLQAIISRILAGSIVPLASAAPGTPKALQNAIHAMLAFDRSRRTRDAASVLRVLSRIDPSGRAAILPAREREAEEGAQVAAVHARPGSSAAAPTTSGTRRSVLNRNPIVLATTIGLVLVTFAAFAFLHRRWTMHATDSGAFSPSVPPPRVSPGVLPSPATEPRSGVASTQGEVKTSRDERATPRRDSHALCAQWPRFLSFAPRLAAGGMVARRAVATLRTLCPIDFGPLASSWKFWLSLSQWLADPTGRVPGTEGRAADDGHPADALITELVDARLRSIPYRLTPEAVAIAFNLLSENPDDGRLWLLLGRVLERDGEAREGLVAYTHALALIRGKPFEAPCAWVWAGLARALSIIPGRKLVEEFADSIAADSDPYHPWQGLIDSLIEPSVPRQDCIRVLERAVASSIESEYAWTYLGEMLLSPMEGPRRDPDKAESIWSQGIARHPGSSALLDDLARFRLDRGDTRGALGAASTASVHSHWPAIIGQLSATSRAQDLATTPTATDPVESLEFSVGAFRLLEENRSAEVTRRLFNLPDAALRRDELSWLVLELLAAGSQDDRFARLGEELLVNGPLKWSRWALASGVFSAPEGVPRMERFLERRRVRARHDGGRQSVGAGNGEYDLLLVEALWYSRRGMSREALAKLESTVSVYPMRSMPPAVVAEILGRPIWMEALGRPQNPDSAARARHLPGPGGSPEVMDYWRDLVQGNLDKAAAEAVHLFRLDPQEPIWSLVAVWNAARHKDRSLLKDSIARAKVCFRVHGVGLWAMRELDAVGKLAERR